MTTLTTDDLHQFWIRVYLNPSCGLIDACIDRAYRDFNRTLRGIREIQTKDKYLQLKKLLRTIINEVINRSFTSQPEFDDWHKGKCESIKQEFINLFNYSITYCQALKWINMSLKYSFAVGENEIKGITRNYHLFHIPIDNVIQSKLSCEDIKKFSQAWSKIDDYEEYLNYQ